jgi:hypothetical protein
MKDTEIIPNYEYVDDAPDLEIIVKIQYQDCEQEPEETFPEHYIFKDFPENYQDKQKPTESDIMFPPRIP